MQDIGHYIALSDSFAQSSLQSWNLLVLMNLGAIGWSVSSRREGATGVSTLPATIIGLALFAASLLAITASTYFTDRAGAALAYVQAVESSQVETTAELDALRAQALAPIGYGFDYFLDKMRQMLLFIIVSGFISIVVLGLLSRVGRR